MRVNRCLAICGDGKNSGDLRIAPLKLPLLELLDEEEGEEEPCRCLLCPQLLRPPPPPPPPLPLLLPLKAGGLYTC